MIVTWADCRPSPLWSPASAAAAPAGRPPRPAWQDIFKFVINLFDQTISIEHSIIRLESQPILSKYDILPHPAKATFLGTPDLKWSFQLSKTFSTIQFFSKTFSFGGDVSFWQSHLDIFPIIGSDDYVTGVNITKVRFYLIWFYCENIDKNLKCARIPSSGWRILTS